MTSFASEVSIPQGSEFFTRFGRFGGNMAKLQKLLSDDELMKEWVQSISYLIEMRERNSYEMAVEVQLAALHRANDEEGWGITKDDFLRLASTAPAWPKGKHAYRSFRIRFGEGDEGVAKTFEAHCMRIQHIFGESGYQRGKYLYSNPTPYKGGKPTERLRLLIGNHTHHAVVDWILADLDTYWVRENVDAVRDAKSLADELLVIAWLFPDRIRATDHIKLRCMFAAGYEVSIPEFDAKTWQRMVVVYFDYNYNIVRVTSEMSNSSPEFSVPRLLRPPSRRLKILK